jgi:hypothetical protein
MGLERGRREGCPSEAGRRPGAPIRLSIAAAAIAAAVAPAHALADTRPPLERVPAAKVLTADQKRAELRGRGAPKSDARTRRGIELLNPHPHRLRTRKARAARRLAPGDRGGPASSAESAAGGGPEPAAAAFLNGLGLVAGNSTPPDSTGAIGPTDYVEIVNREVGVFGRGNLALEDSIDLDDFVGAPGDNVFDPQVQWDPQSGRWLYVADDVAAPGDNFLALGWTAEDTDPDPLPFGGPPGGQWCRLFIDTDDEFDDYPKLGHSDDFILIGTNVFDDSGGPSQDDFLGSRIWAIRKPAAGDDSCNPTDVFVSALPLTTPDGDIAFTPVPVNTFESSANGYVVAADDPFEVANSNEIATWHVEEGAPPPDPPDPVLVDDGDIPVAGFNVPANVPQPGTNAVLDSLDARLTQAVARTNPATGALSVWTQHTVHGPGGRSVVRWYELRTDNLAARQQGTISDRTGFVFNGAISPSSNGSSAVIDHNVGGSSLAAQIQARSRLGGTQLGRMSNAVVLGTSAAANQDFTCFDLGGPCRWGDYAGATPDPANAALVWGSNQVNGPPSADDPAWRTRNFAVLPTATGPDTTITSGPANGTTIATPTTSFGFTSNDAGATFQCRVDGGAFVACSSPRAFGPVPNGAHSFEVRAIGGGGLVDPSAASRSFTVNAPGPTTEITKGPKGKKRTKKKRFKRRFRFEATDPNAAVEETECKLDKKDWKPCVSPQKVKVRAKRKFKRHVFRVRATNELGTTGEAAKRKWKLKRKRR